VPSRTREIEPVSAIMAASATSSGDLRADRRFLYAEHSATEGDDAAAAELLEQCLEIAPDWAPAWFALAAGRERLGERDAAKHAYARALACDRQDALGASLALARLGGESLPAAAAPAYVARLFDQYAAGFDAHLVHALGYRAPALLRDAVVELCADMNRPARFARALDLGCGTGLAGEAFRDCVDYLEGVDLSPGMIAQARDKGVYDALGVSEILKRLRAATERSLHLIIAADVLVYIGDVTPLFTQIRRVLAGGGLFAFTAESHDGEGYVLGNDTRFAHSRDYIAEIARRAGLSVLLLNPGSTRRNKGAAVCGLVGVMAS
jgi:predicted TPR repeat methyltransferase